MWAQKSRVVSEEFLWFGLLARTKRASRTIGSLAVCTVMGVPPTELQEVVAPSGKANLQCRLPDRSGGGAQPASIDPDDANKKPGDRSVIESD